ncbi:MAG: helix-turn-helix domain-containing protein [Burkholderiaceae bacterium]
MAESVTESAAAAPAAGAPDRNVRERIIDAADRLFYLHGINVTGVDAIALEAGVSKRTLYKYFASKERLTAAYLARRATHGADPPGDPLAQLMAVFDGLERRFASKSFRGCPFVNAVCELGADPEHAAVVEAARFKARRRDWFHSRLEALGARDVDMLADQLLIIVDGAIAVSAVRGGDPEVARTARQAACLLLAHAGVALADPA